MGVRVKRYPEEALDIVRDPIFADTTQTQRETTVNGYTFHWGPNEVRNFLDEGVGAAHAAFNAHNSETVIEDDRPFGSPRF